jgi:hypothetical protein
MALTLLQTNGNDDNNRDDELFEDLGPDRALAGQQRARGVGAEADEEAFRFLTDAGAEIERHHFKVEHIPVDALVRGRNGARFWVLAHGSVDGDGRQDGLRRTDTVRKAAASAVQLRRMIGAYPLLVITSSLPYPSSAAEAWLRGSAVDFFDVVAYRGDLAGFHRLRRYFTDPIPPTALPAGWRDREHQLAFDLSDTADFESGEVF